MKKSGSSKDQRFGRSDNTCQNIWNKREQSRKTEQGRKRSTSTFACFFIATSKV